MNFKRKKQGSITIYLSIVVLSVIILICTVCESARVNAVQTKSKDITYMATDSVCAGYAKQIFKDYGVLLVWQNERAKETLEKYIQANIKMADLDAKNHDFLNPNLQDVTIKTQSITTKEGKETFVKQIMGYMKYALPLSEVNALKNKYEKYKDSSENIKEKESINNSIEDKKTDKNLENTAEEFNALTTQISDTKKLEGKITAVIQKKEKLLDDIEEGSKNIDSHNKLVRQFLRKYKKFEQELNVKEGLINDALQKGDTYLKQKNDYLKNNNIKLKSSDYIDENIKKIKEGRYKIKKIKELSILKFKDINLSNINQINNLIVYAQEIVDNLKSLRVPLLSEQDKENQSIFDRAEEFLNNGLINLVVEDSSNISNVSVVTSSLPSKENENIQEIKTEILDKSIIALYANVKFGNYLNVMDKHELKYELEYILNGKETDKKNLLATSEKIIGIRNIMNLLFLIKDSEKMALVSEVALSASTAIGLPFLEPIFKGILIEAWSLAESIEDVKSLLKGEKIPFIKNKSNWNTSLKNLGGKSNKEKNDKGLDYDSYLKILIMSQKDNKTLLRIMDLIQINVCKNYNKTFTIKKCFQNIKVEAKYSILPMFTALNFVANNLSQQKGGYEYKIECSQGY